MFGHFVGSGANALAAVVCFCYNRCMTAEQKAAIAGFLDVAGGFVRAGYFDGHGPYDFADDADGTGIAGQNTASICVCQSPSPDQTQGIEPDGETKHRPQPRMPIALSGPEGEALNPLAGPLTGGLAAVAAGVRSCTLCGLHETRKNAVPGEGAERPLVLVVGEGPGADEDASGRPFVGAAGQLLDKMLLSIGLDRRKNCFIANVVKCRPPGNRDPFPDETAACRPFFERQLDALRPLLILAVGKVPVKTLLGTDEGITRLRGNWKSYRDIPLLPTFHPSYLLRDASQKQFAWEDLKSLCRRLAEIDPDYAAETAELRKARNI